MNVHISGSTLLSEPAATLRSGSEKMSRRSSYEADEQQKHQERIGLQALQT